MLGVLRSWSLVEWQTLAWVWEFPVCCVEKRAGKGELPGSRRWVGWPPILSVSPKKGHLTSVTVNCDCYGKGVNKALVAIQKGQGPCASQFGQCKKYKNHRLGMWHFSPSPHILSSFISSPLISDIKCLRRSGWLGLGGTRQWEKLLPNRSSAF